MKVIGKLHVDLITIHAAGGSAMIQAAEEGMLAGSNQHAPAKILAITQLTSITPQMLADEQLITVPLGKASSTMPMLPSKTGRMELCVLLMKTKCCIKHAAKIF